MLLKASLVAGLTAWLYYRTLLAVPMLSPVWAWYYRSLERECMEKKRRKFEAQFKEMIHGFFRTEYRIFYRECHKREPEGAKASVFREGAYITGSNDISKRA